MRGSRAGGWAVILVVAGIATSCGKATADPGIRQDAGAGTGAAASAGTGAAANAGTGAAAGGSGGLPPIQWVSDGAAISTGGSEGIEAFRCNDLRNDAETIPLSYVAAEPPAARGGTPVEGLYHLTQWELFTGTGGPSSGEVRTRQETISITVEEGRAEMETMFGQPYGEMGILYQWNETLTFDGSSFTSTLTCRADSVSVSDSAGQYSATDDQLVFITQAAEGDGTWVRTYTLQ